MKTYCRLIVVVVTLIALQAAGVTVHWSFRTREAGVGFGTGTAGVAYPVDAKIDKAIDEARQKEAEKTKIIIGKCTRVSDGDTIHVVTDGNEKFKVRLDRIDAPEKDQPHGKESTAYLTSLIRGKTVRVEWVKKDQYGRVLGIVFLPNAALANKRGEAESFPLVKNDPSANLDVNLMMVSTGNAWHDSYFDKTAEYASAEVEARQNRRGLWSDPNPVNPYAFRKAKRK